MVSIRGVDSRMTEYDEMVIDLSLDRERLKQLYRGVARNVVARARDGRWIRFPARALREYVDEFGVRGAFVLRTQQGRLTTLERLAS